MIITDGIGDLQLHNEAWCTTIGPPITETKSMRSQFFRAFVRGVKECGDPRTGTFTRRTIIYANAHENQGGGRREKGYEENGHAYDGGVLFGQETYTRAVKAALNALDDNDKKEEVFEEKFMQMGISRKGSKQIYRQQPLTEPADRTTFKALVDQYDEKTLVAGGVCVLGVLVGIYALWG